MTNIRMIWIRKTVAALELAGICPSKFGYSTKLSHFDRKAKLLAICREVGVSVVCFTFSNTPHAE